MIGITTIALLINIFIKEDLRRLNYDKEQAAMGGIDTSPTRIARDSKEDGYKNPLDHGGDE